MKALRLAVLTLGFWSNAIPLALLYLCLAWFR